jgi:glutathione synthase/RimK-type ligase-like ATP-grasp enzyme
MNVTRGKRRITQRRKIMWANIKVIPSDREIIYLPFSLAIDCKQSIAMEVMFGGKSVNVSVEYTDDQSLEESSFNNPGNIGISDKLKDKLLIPETQVYQVKISDSHIIIGPVIGLLLSNNTKRYNPNRMKKYSDRFGIYHKVGGLIYAFSPKSINWENQTAFGLYYNIAEKSWEYGYFPLPEVIYRREFHSSPKHIKKLIEFTGGKLFNSYRFSKYEFYNYIKRHSELNKYLPPTEMSCRFEQINKFIDRHSKIVLKPIDLSRGRGICIIEKTDSSYKITDYRYRNPKISICNDSQSLENFFIINKNFFKRYLIQKFLPLARVGSSVFDIRVVMQKQQNKVWGCTGIECRVANSDSHLTNISRGGYALFLDEALYQAFPEDHELLARQVNELSEKLCLYMDTLGEHFAEFGLDIGIDIDKKLWLIEANVFPSFKGFKKIDRETYLSIRYTPLLYALALTKFGA